MCMFTGPVERVEATRIFARKVAVDRQLLIYEMKLAAPVELAMVLPLPVVPGSGDAAVRFIALAHVPDFFDVLDGLHLDPTRSMSRPRGRSQPKLEVHKVGAFEASFVPRLADFERLDPRFRMPPGTLEGIPAYADWGFAVFQLASTRALSKVHPMAFEFQTRDPARLFFPTIHCHHGEIHEHAEFSHFLYAQDVPPKTWQDDPARLPWQLPIRSVPNEVLPAKVRAMLAPEAPVVRCRVFGWQPNQDTWARLQRQSPSPVQPMR